jgi:ectoine hydroxylase
MLSENDIRTYWRDGLLVLPGLFDPVEVGTLQAAFERDATIPGEHRISEPDGTEVRAVYASHTRQAEYRALTCSARLLRSAQQLIGEDVYLYQLKINSKAAFGGDSWAWHQDYVAWKLADNIPGPELVNVVVFLDDVSEFNGPIIFVPGSHADGLARKDRNVQHRSAQHLDPDDIALSHADMAELVGRHGQVSPKGEAGTVVFFHPEIVHGSAANMSPFQRRLAIVTYNQVNNAPRPVGEPRPAYLVGRDTRPLVAQDAALVPERA